MYVYTHTHTYSSQYGDTGQAEEIKEYGTAVNAASLEVFPHATVGTHAIGSSALPSRNYLTKTVISGLLLQSVPYVEWTQRTKHAE
jgi:hypothetical protein